MLVAWASGFLVLMQDFVSVTSWTAPTVYVELVMLQHLTLTYIYLYKRVYISTSLNFNFLRYAYANKVTEFWIASSDILLHDLLKYINYFDKLLCKF